MNPSYIREEALIESAVKNEGYELDEKQEIRTGIEPSITPA